MFPSWFKLILRMVVFILSLYTKIQFTVVLLDDSVLKFNASKLSIFDRVCVTSHANHAKSEWISKQWLMSWILKLILRDYCLFVIAKEAISQILSRNSLLGWLMPANAIYKHNNEVKWSGLLHWLIWYFIGLLAGFWTAKFTS